jgi:DNA-binding response OmpR family regulator
MMETINGFSIFHRIKSSSATASISVIAMTGVSTEENKKKIVKLGADICLGTPINFSLLERNTLQFIKQKKLVL